MNTKNETLRIILWRLTRRRETNWKMNSLRTYLEQKGGKKGAINTNFDTIRNGRTTNGIQVMMTFPVPFISTLSTSLPYRVRSVVMRAKVREFNVISFLICDSWNSPELSSSLPPSPSLPRRRTTVISFQLSPRVRPESRIHWITT